MTTPKQKATQMCFSCEIKDLMARGIRVSSRDLRRARLWKCTCPKKEGE